MQIALPIFTLYANRFGGPTSNPKNRVPGDTRQWLVRARDMRVAYAVFATDIVSTDEFTAGIVCDEASVNVAER